MTTISELFKQYPVRIDTGVEMLVGFYYNHVPEIEDYDIKAHCYDEGFAPKIEQIVFHEVKIDHRRSHVLFGVRYDGAWVMLCSNAGRELDDYYKRQIVDAEAYADMINYIRLEMARLEKAPTPEVSDPDTTEVEFNFYGRDVRQPYYHDY